MTDPHQPLRGINVLVTRPAEQADSLCELIQRHGGEAIRFPVIEIISPGDAELLAALSDLDNADLLIFVSAHAASHVSALLHRHQLRIPPHARVATVGPATAKRCVQAGIHVDFVPTDSINSEGLLETLEGFDVRDKRVLIFRGQSGRELIKQTLHKRGARVRYVESYRRRITDQPIEPLIARWRGNQVDVVTITSVAVMEALQTLIGPDNAALLEETPIFTYSRRVANHCRDSGVLSEIVTAKKPSDEAIVEAIIHWAAD